MVLLQFLLLGKAAVVYLKHSRRYIHWGHDNEINQSGDKPRLFDCQLVSNLMQLIWHIFSV